MSSGRHTHVFVVLALAAAALAVGVTQAEAVVVNAPPTWPIPADVPTGPPPIPELPAATDAPPPVDEISDPVTPSAACGGWYLQSNYGDRWAAPATWWEYRCTYSYSEYHNTCPGPACDAFCPSCYWQTDEWTDSFFWDGSNAVFYGEAYSSFVVFDSEDSYFSAFWWDAPTAQWYDLGEPDTTPPETTIVSGPSGPTNATSATFEFVATEPSTFDCAVDGGPFGGCASPATYSDLAAGVHTFSVRATDAAGNLDASPAERVWRVNTPPTAAFTFTCAGRFCSFDPTASADGDGTLVRWDWSFGDGTTGSGATVSHAYPQAGTYAVTLTVTDNDAAAGSYSSNVNVVTLTARGSKVKGIQKVDLAWSSVAGATFDVYRDEALIATVATTAYAENLGRRAGMYVYRVCVHGAPICSNDATVSL